MSLPSEESLSASKVVAAVLVSDLALLPETLQAIERQVYGPAKVFVVGASTRSDSQADIRARADSQGLGWAPSTAALLELVEPDVSHIWFVHDGAVPRPDALQALAVESARAEASVAGSKLLRKDRPDELLAIGMATDVYDTPYLGLDAGEVDQGQYDVVRDVAAVLGASVLVRRDLAAGIGGIDPLLAPEAASIDLCQRARLRGARIVVVPSSEVLYPPEQRRASAWREEAGRIRAMAKAYGLLTLVWALPLAFVIGLIEALIVPFLGRWTLFTWVRAWLWNLFHLPSTVGSRRAGRRGRVMGDDELFRYQIRGSARLRSLFGDIASRIRTRLPEETRFDFADLGREFRRPALVTGVIVMALVFVGTRRIWRLGISASGYALPLPDSATQAIAAYAGGWNPAGFGSREPLPPVTGFAAVVQLLFFDRPALTMTLLTVGAAVLGVWGMVRFLRGIGVESVGGLLGGLILVAGPAAQALTGETHWASYVAMGAMPWLLRSATKPVPRTWMGRIGRVASIGWLTAVVAGFSPWLLVAPLAVTVIWVLLGEARYWGGVILTALGAAIAVPVLLPWVGLVDFADYAARGAPAFWQPGIVVVVAVGLALLFTVVSAPKQIALVAGLGGVLAAGGAVLARSADLGAGRSVEAAGLVVASVGLATLTSAAVSAMRESADALRGPAWFRVAAVVAGSVLVLASIPPLVPGRMGFPGQDLSDELSFTLAADPVGASRVLLFGSPDRLPGEWRTLDGAAYRVVSSPVPQMWEAWLNEPLSADSSLETTLRTLVAGESTRLGEELAQYGIGWVAVLGESPFEPLLAGQLDLVRIGTNFPVYVNQSPDAVRALPRPDSVDPWVWQAGVYVGGESERVLLAENADARGGPGDWEQLGWANEVAGTEGRAWFEPRARVRSQGIIALLVFGGLLGISLWGRWRS